MEQLISAKDWRARVPRSQITTRKRASNADDVPKVYTWGKSRLSVQKLLKRSTPPRRKKKVSLSRSWSAYVMRQYRSPLLL